MIMMLTRYIFIKHCADVDKIFKPLDQEVNFKLILGKIKHTCVITHYTENKLPEVLNSMQLNFSFHSFKTSIFMQSNSFFTCDHMFTISLKTKVLL